ncbi:hypothetical protein [Hyphomicrobium denitrificans]|uniref:hypothetical protein n=1 Tax=Hyphomicrobium denitrificans TaxID=53399 RepID=UPI0001B0F542|nr:hypothetical protein [Hyphomicrobium denitrificans]
MRIEGEHNLWSTQQIGYGNQVAQSGNRPLISGSNNSFVTLQVGNFNEIAGATVGNGNANQVAFTQSGAANALTFVVDDRAG